MKIFDCSRCFESPYSYKLLVNWMRENYVEALGEKVQLEAMYKDYLERFCGPNRLEPKRRADFGKIVRMCFSQVRRKRLGPAGLQVSYYVGIMRLDSEEKIINNNNNNVEVIEKDKNEKKQRQEKTKKQTTYVKKMKNEKEKRNGMKLVLTEKKVTKLDLSNLKLLEEKENIENNIEKIEKKKQKKEKKKKNNNNGSLLLWMIEGEQEDEFSVEYTEIENFRKEIEIEEQQPQQPQQPQHMQHTQHVQHVQHGQQGLQENMWLCMLGNEMECGNEEKNENNFLVPPEFGLDRTPTLGSFFASLLY